MLHLSGAAVHILSPLQHHAGQPVPGQEQGGEQARRPHAHHHGHGGGAPPHLRKDIRPGERQGDIPASGPLHRLLLTGMQGYVHCIDIMDVLFFSGVDGLAHQSERLQRARADAQSTGRLVSQLLQIPVQRQGNILNSYHNFITCVQCTIFYVPLKRAGTAWREIFRGRRGVIRGTEAVPSRPVSRYF